MAAFYKELMISEAGHYTTFLKFAKKYTKKGNTEGLIEKSSLIDLIELPKELLDDDITKALIDVINQKNDTKIQNKK